MYEQAMNASLRLAAELISLTKSNLRITVEQLS